MCWWLFSCEMYEGKNIHYSPVDNKPLCSFSQKQCNQRRLNGYAFCVRHILEDPTAPFRRCAYVAKSSQHLCTQAIPQGEQRQYCNNHMQVLGMLPRRERKPKKEKDKDKDKEKKEKEIKDKDNLTPSDTNKMTFGDRLKSKKLSLSKPAHSPLLGKVLNPVDDPDDPYAFHDAAPEVSPVANSMGQTGLAGGMSGGLADMASRSPYPQSLPSPSQSRPMGEGMGGLSKAKLYPELAEKLEKVRPGPEAKTAKARARSSRTMNKLQTKIAQNKIKDKLRKSQESNQAELSPSQVASPERLGLGATALFNSGIVGGDFGPISRTELNSVGLGSSHLQQLALPGLGLTHMDGGGSRGMGVGSLAGSAPHLMGMEHLSHGSLPSQLLSPRHPLPPPYPGLPVHRERPFSPTPVHVSTSALGQQPPVEKPPITTSLPSHTPLQPFLSFSQASSLSSPVVSPAQSQPHHVHPQHQSPHSNQPLSQKLPSHGPPALVASALGALPKDSADLSFPSHHPSVLNQSLASRQPHLDSAVSAFPQTSAILTSKHAPSNPLLSPTAVDVGSSLNLPPPPPYVPRSHACPVPTSLTNQSSVLLTRVNRAKGVLTEKEAHCRLKNDAAVKLYGMYAHQRINNHVFMDSCMSLCASDEEESSDEEMNDEHLPYQRDWKALSDDEEDNELEEDGELPSDLRMVKLGVMRARSRRHCTQTKHATRINTKSMAASKKYLLALIKLARESPSIAARTLSAIHNKPLEWPQERKRSRKTIWRKVCQYKDGADKQCTDMCLPYTNHCHKHVMYNVDQLLFQFCTAKNSDNTQCCMPVIDLTHDFPLCFPHALQAEQQQKEEAAEVKKRPRKKTKPPALTRPPRKGKKKKGKNVRPQKPMPPDKPTGDISMPFSEPMEVTPSVPELQPDTPAPTAAPASQPPAPAPPAPLAAASMSHAVVKEKAGSTSTSGGVRVAKDSRHLEQALGSVDLEETLSPDFDKPFELPLEQASRLLEDQDFENFPDDAFNDIFSMADKNGEPDALAQENEKLERQLAEVTDNVVKAKDTLDKLLNGTITMEDVPEQDTKQLAEIIALNFPSFSVDPVPQAEIATSTAPALDPYSAVPRDQPIGGMAMSMPPQSQLAQTPLTEYGPLGAALVGNRCVVSQTVTSVSSFLPAGVSTTVNGITVSNVPQSSSPYTQAMLANLSASYAGASAIQPQSGGGQVYSEGRLPQGYHMVQTAGQGQGQLAGFSSLHGLTASAVLLSGAGGELSASQQQALLARGVSSLQGRVAATASPSPSPQVGSGTLHPQQGPGGAGPARPQSRGGTLHPQPGPGSSSAHPAPSSSLASVHPQQDPGVVSVHPHPGPSTTGLAGQLQAQPALAAQLASGSHSTWVHAAALQQQAGGTASYHINGFPATAQLPYSKAAVTANAIALQQPKFSSVPGHMNNMSPATRVTGNATASLSTITKRDLHLGSSHSSTIMVSQAPSPPVSGLKQAPRIAALTQHSRTGGRSRSPGLPGYGPVHSPSPTPSPQGLNQTLPPFSPALPAYQGSGAGS